MFSKKNFLNLGLAALKRHLFSAIANSLGKNFLLLRILFLWKQKHLKIVLPGRDDKKEKAFQFSLAHLASYHYCTFLEGVKVTKK